MLIGFDFDGVLFDTNSFIEKLDSEIENFAETYNEARSNGKYDFEKHVEILGVSRKEITDLISKADQFIFDDVQELKKIKDKHRIIIVTRGDSEFQRKKIENSGIQDIIDEYIIIDRDIAGFPKDKVGIELLIDDKEEEVKATEKDSILFNREENDLKQIVRTIEQKYS